MIEPGQPWVMITGSALVVLRPDVDEVDVEAVDLGQELRHGIQPRLEPPQVVVGGPVANELLHGRPADALRRVGDGFLLWPARRLEPTAELVDLGLGHLDPEPADRLGARSAVPLGDEGPTAG